ncbi:unnamed protein product [Porites evermanni]|uniref:RRM domain-containing protein n=1 Tax=Porites evermanni TaxID=104178 RepID=A0ABN8QLW3_9CNID|nr:unnamed protein product [Porites evermanni]
MASRWRTWDQDFFIDVHASKKPEETELIPALGHGRGKPPKDIGSIALPRAALGITKEKKTSHASAPGRGRASMMKARALTDSPPFRRPGERSEKMPISILNQREAFPPLAASNPVSSSPKWVKESQSRSNKGTTKPVTRSTRNSRSDTNSVGIKGDVLSSTDGGDVIIIENFPTSITEKDLVDLFKPYGEVLACVIERDSNGVSLGTSLIRMENRTACEWIINTFSGEEYPGASEPMVCRFLVEDEEHS